MLPDDLCSLIDTMLPVLARFHAAGDLAPHAATVDATGSVKGSALVTDGSADLTVDEAIDELEFRHTVDGLAGEITAAAVFYHAAECAGEFRPARYAREANAIVAHVENERGASYAVVIPYERDRSGGWAYLPPRAYEKQRRVFPV